MMSFNVFAIFSASRRRCAGGRPLNALSSSLFMCKIYRQHTK